MIQRMFISSVMRDYQPIRQAAKEAVSRLRHQPVMAEDFGASPLTPQQACLEGVRGSDIYLGIFGERYGYIAPTSGIAATEEEYREAQKLGVPILCFVQNGPKEPRQGAFLQGIKDYESGHFVASFDTPQELQMAIVQAINDQIGRAGVASLTPQAAKAACDRLNWGSRRANQSGTWLGGILVPERSGETFLNVLDFSRKPFRDRLLQPAILVEEPLFDISVSSVQHEEEGDSLVFKQESSRSVPMVRLEIHPDGSLVFGTLLGTDTTSSGFSSSFLIDEEAVERKLIAFLVYAEQFFRNLPRGEMLQTLYFGSSLTGIEHRGFGRSPQRSQGGISVPMHNLPSPLTVPSQPLRVSRAELASTKTLARTMVEHIARVFRQARAYHEATGSAASTYF